jgi:UDP-N-acetylglucosamine 4,6-dehydratase
VKNIKIIGIKPGEKINEIMIDKNEAKNTYEFGDHFRIVPRIFSPVITEKMTINGKKVKKDFEYVSNINKNWIKKNKIKKIIKEFL